MKLNFGCGHNRLEGFINVDKYDTGKQDLIHDLSGGQLPWNSDSVDEIHMIHFLEHLAYDPEVRIFFLKEVYRICKDKAKIKIVVPHPRHDNFLNDPTHVWPITAETFNLFDLEKNKFWRDNGYSNSTLAIEHGINFKVIGHKYDFEENTKHLQYIIPNFPSLIPCLNNVINQITIMLEVIKSGN